MVEAMARPVGLKPFSSARVRIIEGEQGSGKSITAVAKIVDSYQLDCIRIFCQEHNIKCIVKSYDARRGIAKVQKDGAIRMFKMPSSYKLHSPMRIFCNFHLYGIPYVYCPSFRDILSWLKQDIIRDGWLVIDEYYIGGNARESMSALGRQLEKQSFQYRKMRLEVMILTPMARLIDWTARIIPTERISCEYEEKTGNVTLQIRKKGHKGTREITYDSKPYRKYYWTEERIIA
jgi:hypothetical protein